MLTLDNNIEYDPSVVSRYPNQYDCCSKKIRDKCDSIFSSISSFFKALGVISSYLTLT